MAKDLLWDLVGTNSDLAGGLELFVIEKYIDNLPDLTAGEKSDLDNVAYLVIDRHASKETITKALYTILWQQAHRRCRWIKLLSTLLENGYLAMIYNQIMTLSGLIKSVR